MAAAVAESRPSTELCRICRDAPVRQECFVAVQGEERPICRACWELAVLSPRQAARRLQDPGLRSRFRIS